MAKDYTSLLGKSSGTSWGEIAGAYLSGGKKKDNRARNVMLATLFFNAKESRMQSNVMKNLQEMERQKTFDNAQMTDKWNAYNSLMDEDKAFKADPNYFKVQAESKFNKLNPNFPTSGTLLESEKQFKIKEIQDYQKALESLHLEKLKTGNIKKRLSKQEFFKPFEDYYVGQEKQIASPENVSLVHKGWNFVTGNKKEELTEQQKIDNRKKATKGSFGFLLNPDEIKDDAVIELYRDPNEFTFNKDEASLNIIQNVKDTELQRSIISKLPETGITRNKLKARIITESVDFDPLLAKIDRVNNQYDTILEKEGKTIPNQDSKPEELLNYTLRKQNYVAQRVPELGEDKSTIDLRNKIYTLEDLKNQGISNDSPLIKSLEADIRNAGIDKFTLTILNSITSEIVSPITSDYLEKQGVDLNDYAAEKLEQMLTIYEQTIFNKK
jgi:hypothetical protein